MRLLWEGDLVEAKVNGSSKRALKKTAEFVLEMANRTVPHEEGTLERSGAVDSDDTSATISYGTPYARRQHEELDYRHAEGRRAKWLERTLTEQENPINELFAETIGEAF